MSLILHVIIQRVCWFQFDRCLCDGCLEAAGAGHGGLSEGTLGLLSVPAAE